MNVGMLSCEKFDPAEEHISDNEISHFPETVTKLSFN